METVIGVFRDAEAADRAVETLKEAGFSDSVRVIARERAIREKVRKAWRRPPKVDLSKPADGKTSPFRKNVMETTGAQDGGIVGGLAGLFVGRRAIVIPGMGNIVASGSMRTAILEEGDEEVTENAITSALIDAGLARDDALLYIEGIRRGWILVLADARDGRGDIAQVILNNVGAVNVDEEIGDG